MTEPAERAVEFIPSSEEVRGQIAVKTKELSLLRGLLRLALKAEDQGEPDPEAGEQEEASG